MTDQYGKMIFITEEAKESLRNLSEGELQYVCSKLAYDIQMNNIRIWEEMYKKNKDEKE